MLIKLTENIQSPQYGSLRAGLVLNFSDKDAVELLNAGAASAVRTVTPKEKALAP